MGIKYPIVDDVIKANKKAVELLRETKAEKYELIRSKSAIEAVIEKAKKYDGNLKGKAAVLLREINGSHFFGSANKRTSFLVAADFLLTNEGVIPLKKKEDVKFLIEIREGKRSLEEIERWLDE